MGKLSARIALVLGAIWTIWNSTLVVLAFWVHRPWAHVVERHWARGWCRILGIRLHYHHLDRIPRYPAYVVAPNHNSNFDIVVMSTVPHNFKYLSKSSVRFLPFLGQALWVLGTYWIKRDRSGRDLEVMKRVERRLGEGISVLIFPEGTRSRDGNLGRLKKGAFKTAANAGAPLLPVGLSGTFAISPRGKLPSRRGFPVHVNIGEPFHVDPEAPVEQEMQRFEEVMLALLEENSRFAGKQ